MSPVLSSLSRTLTDDNLRWRSLCRRFLAAPLPLLAFRVLPQYFSLYRSGHGKSFCLGFLLIRRRYVWVSRLRVIIFCKKFRSLLCRKLLFQSSSLNGLWHFNGRNSSLLDWNETRTLEKPPILNHSFSIALPIFGPWVMVVRMHTANELRIDWISNGLCFLKLGLNNQCNSQNLLYSCFKYCPGCSLSGPLDVCRRYLLGMWTVLWGFFKTQSAVCFVRRMSLSEEI